MKVNSKEEMVAIIKKEGHSAEGQYKGFDFIIGRQKEMHSFYVHLYVDNHMDNTPNWEKEITPHGEISWNEVIDGRHVIAFDFARTGDLTPLNAFLSSDSELKENKLKYWSMEEVQAECARVIDELAALKGS